MPLRGGRVVVCGALLRRGGVVLRSSAIARTLLVYRVWRDSRVTACWLCLVVCSPARVAPTTSVSAQKVADAGACAFGAVGHRRCLVLTPFSRARAARWNSTESDARINMDYSSVDDFYNENQLPVGDPHGKRAFTYAHACCCLLPPP